MNIVVLDGFTANPGDLSWSNLSALGNLTVYDRTSYSEKDADLIVKRAYEADIILTNKTPLTAKIIDSLPNLKYVGVIATGYNVVDLEKAKERGIVVCNAPAYSTSCVVQHVFALLLEVCNRVSLYSDSVLSGEWLSSPDFCYFKAPILELAGKTLGIVGFGSIGKSVANIALAFGMRVLVYTRTPKQEYASKSLSFVSLDTLLAESDFISLHCPLTDTNREMINKESISKMKDGSVLINTARGPLVNEQDLADALNSGKLAFACVDVVSKEPIAQDNPLLSAKNIIITPHVAWASIESRQRLLDVVTDNVKAFLDGSPVNVVNK